MSIFKFFLDPTTHFDAIFRRHGNGATVKERVHVLAEQNPVVDRMRSIIGVRSYVRSFEDVQYGRVSERTAPLVRIRNQHTKGSLTEPWQYELWRTKARPHLCDFHWAGIRTLVKLQPILNLLPNGQSSLFGRVVAFPLNYIRGPIGSGNPLIFRKKERGLKKDAANLIVFKRTRRNPTVTRKPSPHFLFILSAILDCKRTPSKADRKDGEVAEESAAADVVLGAMQLEKEGLAGLEGPKLSATARLPEINFVRSSTPREV